MNIGITYTLLSKFCSIICQVGRKCQFFGFKRAYKSWSLTRGFKYSDLSFILVFLENWSLRRDGCYQRFNCNFNWLSFISLIQEPEVEFEAESQFEGKNLPQLSSLIINHLRKSIQKKHTLPSYKIRYSPFFLELSPQDETQEVYVHNSLATVGSLEVTVVGCTRLPELENRVWQFCSLSVDPLPWSRLAENKRAMWPTFEVSSSIILSLSVLQGSGTHNR